MLGSASNNWLHRSILEMEFANVIIPEFVPAKQEQWGRNAPPVPPGCLESLSLIPRDVQNASVLGELKTAPNPLILGLRYRNCFIYSTLFRILKFSKLSDQVFGWKVWKSPAHWTDWQSSRSFLSIFFQMLFPCRLELAPASLSHLMYKYYSHAKIGTCFALAPIKCTGM